jgi:hypothetical protein
MDESAAGPDLPPPHLDTVRTGYRAELVFLALLVALTVGLRAWQLTHTAVTARDSIGYIRIAWNLEHGSWPDVFRHSHQHPAYSIAIRAMSVPVRQAIPDLARAMQVSTQLVSALASVLLVIPLYFLGRELFAPNIAFWGVLLFQCLPSSGRIMADGLSEPLFLLFAATSLVLALRALRTGWFPGFALAGLASGAAYLTRPEGAFIAAATGLVLLAQQLSVRWRRPWPAVLRSGTALSVGLLLLAGPFMMVIGGLSLKSSAHGVLTNTSADSLRAPWLRSGAEIPTTVTSELFAMWWDKVSAIVAPEGAAARRGWGIRALGLCLAKGLFFVGVVPGLIGLWVFRDRFRLLPGGPVLLLLAAALLLVLYRVAVLIGYLSDRHLILITMVACFWVVAGTVVMGRWLAAWDRRPHAVTAWVTGLLMLLCAGPALKSLPTLHAERTGFREAGRWLAKNAQPGDRVVDPYTWASYYAGRVFRDDDDPESADEAPVWYVVVDETPNKHSHLDAVDQAKEMAKEGHEVGRWNLRGGDVAIYEIVRKPRPGEKTRL